MRAVLSILTTVLLASSALATDAAETVSPVSCEGVFGIDTSHERLVAEFGAGNVVEGEIPGPEGISEMGTIVFPDDPANRITIVWWTPETLSDPGAIDFGSAYSLTGGVTIGQTPAEVEAINGAPFEISGFGWDYGGFADFGEGALGPEGGCFLSVRFSIENAGDVDIGPISGEGTVKSDDETLRQTDAAVSAIGLGYAHPDERD